MHAIESAVIIALLSSINPGTQAAGKVAVKPYHLIQEIKIGGDGFWDCLSVDPDARRLYVTHGTRVVVIDMNNNTVLGSIADTPGVHAIAIAPGLKRGFTSNGREAKVSVVDLTTLTTLAKVDTGDNPDAMLFEPGQREVYAFNGRSQSATVISAPSGKVVATIALPGKPEFAVADASAGRVYINIEDKSVLVAIDTHSHSVVSTWPSAPCESPSGLAMDIARHRLFLGCENELMVMMDSTNGKVVATVPVGRRVDGTEFDPATQLAFSSNGDGTVTIAHEDSPSTLKVVQTLKTAAGARTMTLDPVTHRIYLAVAEMLAASDDAPTGTAVPGSAGQPPGAEPPGGYRPPPMVPDSFKVLVYGID